MNGTQPPSSHKAQIAHPVVAGERNCRLGVQRLNKLMATGKSNLLFDWDAGERRTIKALYIQTKFI